jgi:leader peptidase (prepilin peptidase) / N-methyltransferase
MIMLEILIVIISGLVIGSFLNVVIYRLSKNESIILPGSHCPYCKARLKPYDLIPVFSFILLKGKCRYCGHKIDWQYPVVELLSGILFLVFFLKTGLSSRYFVLTLLLLLLIICSAIDLRSRIIPNKVTYTGIITGLFLSIYILHNSPLATLLNLIIPALVFYLLAIITRGMGIGDVKLVAMIGAFIGWQYTLMGVFLGSLVGSILGLSLIGTGLIERKTRIPFGPLISLGVIIMILFGSELIRLYTDLFW